MGQKYFVCSLQITPKLEVLHYIAGVVCKLITEVTISINFFGLKFIYTEFALDFTYATIRRETYESLERYTGF